VGKIGCKKNARNRAGISSGSLKKAICLTRYSGYGLPVLVITRSATIIMVVTVPASVGENDTAAQGQKSDQGNQQCDSTEHFKILMVEAALKPNLFIGCNMRLRLLPFIPVRR